MGRLSFLVARNYELSCMYVLAHSGARGGERKNADDLR